MNARRVATASVLLALLLHFLALFGQAGAAEAAGTQDGYRYWSFWQQKKQSWSYATQGPSVLRPGDGDVLGFRFAVSADSKDAKTPRGAAEFGSACDRTEAKPGSKRVAVRVDFGTAADAPKGETPPKPRTGCARVSEDATAADALAAVAKPLRYNSDALLCGIEGFPKSGCGERTSAEGKTGTGTDAGSGDKDHEDGGGLPKGLGIGAGAVVVAGLAGAAVWQARRRRD
ncbi:SCO2322 family protein [Streptomyces sp. ODS28]|uniref:SCO2322 family protein n=1 Tax=Streptomyces sp. ODS28 TaxID=3136688 RepID=UPI0031EC3488